MSTTRAAAGLATLADGRVLVVGGSTPDPNGGDYFILKTCEIFDPKSNTWTRAASMKSPRSLAAVVRLPDGRVLAAGGMIDFRSDSAKITDSAEVYDPKSNTWTSVSPMPQPRFLGGAALSGADVLVAGGMISDHFDPVGSPFLASVVAFSSD
jgi:N-acetylneuraminic acid mutarotase